MSAAAPPSCPCEIKHFCSLCPSEGAATQALNSLTWRPRVVSLTSRFAVKAGAKHVIGVDMSTIIFKAREIVQVNGMSDKITLIQGKMEEIAMPFPKVDIIISEWMGYFLLYESMLDTVLYARDKYLAKDGLIFPDKASIFVAGIEDGEYKEEKIGCKRAPTLRLPPGGFIWRDAAGISILTWGFNIQQSGTTSTASTTPR